MNLFSKDFFKVVRNNFQFVYGVVLLVLIPGAFVVITVLFIGNTDKVIDIELQRKASLANSIISSDIANDLADHPSIQSRIEAIAADNDEIRGLDVLIPKGEDFKIIASLDPEAVGEVSKYFYNTIAWQGGDMIAYETFSGALSTEDQHQIGGERFWVVVNPVQNEANEKVAIVSVKMSSKVIDDLANDNLNKSVIVLIITLVAVILLLVNNTRLFHYASLFRKLKEVDKMKDEFISMASHELRAPITGIRGYLEMIVEGSFGELSEEAHQKLAMVLEESNRLHDLVEDLLEVSRIDQGRIKLTMKPLALEPVINGVVKTFDQQAKEKSLQLVTDIKPDLPYINVDESRLKQVLVNLTSNAIKYTMNGKITISAELVIGKEDMVKIKVSDTGIGMSAKDREHLFEKFYRVRNAKTDKITGTGLGLWITQEIIQLMKGEIYVDSIENVGTQVTVLFPPIKKQG